MPASATKITEVKLFSASLEIKISYIAASNNGFSRGMCAGKWRHDNQHNDTRPKDIQHNSR
jgi:hypothetical protein